MGEIRLNVGDRSKTWEVPNVVAASIIAIPIATLAGLATAGAFAISKAIINKIGKK